MAQVALLRTDERTNALREIVGDIVKLDEPRIRLGGMMSGLDVRYDVGDGHPLLGRRMPDLDIVTPDGPMRVFELLHEARPVLLNFAAHHDSRSGAWADRVRVVDADYDGAWELPVIGTVTAPASVLIRPDGYVAWVGEGSAARLADALTTWFGEPPAA
jgi:hypothetical protein